MNFDKSICVNSKTVKIKIIESWSFEKIHFLRSLLICLVKKRHLAFIYIHNSNNKVAFFQNGMQ